MATFEKLRNEILMNDMTLKLRSRHCLTVSELEVFSKQRRSIELITTTWAAKFLVDPVVLKHISNCSLYHSYHGVTHLFDMKSQPRS
jgi:hypothetical protein